LIQHGLNQSISTDEQKNVSLPVYPDRRFFPAEGRWAWRLATTWRHLCGGQLAKGLDASWQVPERQLDCKHQSSESLWIFENVRMGLISNRLFDDLLRVSTNLPDGDNSTLATNSIYGELSWSMISTTGDDPPSTGRTSVFRNGRTPNRGAGLLLTNARTLKELFRLVVREVRGFKAMNMMIYFFCILLALLFHLVQCHKECASGELLLNKVKIDTTKGDQRIGSEAIPLAEANSSMFIFGK
jgi:hypothetical protein